VTVATYMRSEVLIVGGGLGGVAAALAARCVRTGVTPHQVAIPGDDNVLVKAGSCPAHLRPHACGSALTALSRHVALFRETSR
jgi:hypothetical protein